MQFMKKLSVRYIAEYLVLITIFRIIRLFRMEKAANMAASIAKKVCPLLKLTKVAEDNLKKVYGEKIDSNRIINKLWDNFGRFIGEFPHIPYLSNQDIDKYVNIRGFENIQLLKEKNIPFILFSGHFANWELTLHILTKFYPNLAIVYRQANNPLVNKLLYDMRNISNVILIAKGSNGIRNLATAIKKRYTIAMLVDQKMNEGIKVPLCNIPAMTAPVIAKLALKYHYPLVPLQIVRKQGSYFDIILEEPRTFSEDISLSEQENIYNVMQYVNNFLTKWIYENPEQWLWFHRRW